MLYSSEEELGDKSRWAITGSLLHKEPIIKKMHSTSIRETSQCNFLLKTFNFLTSNHHFEEKENC